MPEQKRDDRVPGWQPPEPLRGMTGPTRVGLIITVLAFVAILLFMVWTMTEYA